MKTKTLIAKLQELDPSGEIEVCVGNVDIHFLSREGAYYDGALQVLKRDPALEGKCFNIIGAELRQVGEKIQVHTLSIRDLFWDLPDAPVEFVWPEDPQYRTGIPRYQASIDVWRKEARDETEHTPPRAGAEEQGDD